VEMKSRSGQSRSDFGALTDALRLRSGQALKAVPLNARLNRNILKNEPQNRADSGTVNQREDTWLR
jgi:hypothetical protein